MHVVNSSKVYWKGCNVHNLKGVKKSKQEKRWEVRRLGHRPPAGFHRSIEKTVNFKKNVDNEAIFCEIRTSDMLLKAIQVLEKMNSLNYIVVVVIRGAGLLLSLLLVLLVVRSKPPGLIM